MRGCSGPGSGIQATGAASQSLTRSQGSSVDGVEEEVGVEQHQRAAGPSSVSIASATLE